MLQLCKLEYKVCLIIPRARLTGGQFLLRHITTSHLPSHVVTVSLSPQPHSFNQTLRFPTLPGFRQVECTVSLQSEQQTASSTPTPDSARPTEFLQQIRMHNS